MPLEIRPGSGAGDSGGGAPGGGSGLSPDTLNGVYVTVDAAGPVVVSQGESEDLSVLLDDYTPVGDPEWASWNAGTHRVSITESGLYRIHSQHDIIPPNPLPEGSSFRTRGIWIEGGAWDVLDNPPAHPYPSVELPFSVGMLNPFTSAYSHVEREVTYLTAGATVTLGYLVIYATGVEDTNVYWGELAISKIG